MSDKEKKLHEKLLDIFKVEAAEHVQSISLGLIELEKAPTADARAAITETVHRAAHSLKGAARAVSLANIEMLCHALESVFAKLLKGTVADTPELFDILHQGVDTIAALLDDPKAELGNRIHALVGDLARLAESGKSIDIDARPAPAPTAKPVATEPPTPLAASNPPPAVAPEPPAPLMATPPPPSRASPSRAAPAKQPPQGTVRIPAERLDALLLQVEETLSAKLAAQRRAAELATIVASIHAWRQEWTRMRGVLRQGRHVENSANTIANHHAGDSPALLGRLLNFVESGSATINLLADDLARLSQTSNEDARALERMVAELLADMKQVLMLPCSSLVDIFPKMVRDLSRDRGKETELVIDGGDIEIDKRILEQIKDPLIHLLRNCVDHGIEPPAQREASGKSPRGRIAITISRVQSSKIEIVIADDGAGIDVSRVKAAAVKTGTLGDRDADQLAEGAAISLIYASGVTTSPILTDVSGRGLGLAIVRERVEQLGGVISVQTRPQIGTTFRMVLPLTLAACRAVALREADREFLVPSANVERVIRLRTDAITTIENRASIDVNGDVLSLVALRDVLELPARPPAAASSDYTTAIILSAGGTRIAFQVDAVLCEQEILIKSLGPQLTRVRNISGAMIRGDGEVALILNLADLMKSATLVSAHRGSADTSAVPVDLVEKSILVVDDSITSRMLLKSILESAGYRVTTAVDGAEAMATLGTEPFDLVVSDIEMPRLNGFELTVRIRENVKLANLPVVLVTALDAREDRERGVEAGANAYLLKSSFDQSNLLETVQRLI